jgi:hypothetical protein
MSRQCAGDKRSSEELFFKHRKIIDETYYITPRKAVLNICYGLEKSVLCGWREPLNICVSEHFGVCLQLHLTRSKAGIVVVDPAFQGHPVPEYRGSPCQDSNACTRRLIYVQSKARNRRWDRSPFSVP